MKSKLLTEEEKEFLKNIVEKILKPIDGRVVFGDKPTKFHCFRGESSFNLVEWDEYVYHILIESKKGNTELIFCFNDTPLIGWAWHVAADAFHKLDDDINGLVAENLWPKDNRFLPDYKRF